VIKEKEMKCSNCGMRWADLPLGFPYEMPTKEEEVARLEIFNNDEVRCCPDCIEELNAQMDYEKQRLINYYKER